MVPPLGHLPTKILSQTRFLSFSRPVSGPPASHDRSTTTTHIFNPPAFPHLYCHLPSPNHPHLLPNYYNSPSSLFSSATWNREQNKSNLNQTDFISLPQRSPEVDGPCGYGRPTASSEMHIPKFLLCHSSTQHPSPASPHRAVIPGMPALTAQLQPRRRRQKGREEHLLLCQLSSRTGLRVLLTPHRPTLRHRCEGS